MGSSHSPCPLLLRTVRHTIGVERLEIERRNVNLHDVVEALQVFAAQRERARCLAAHARVHKQRGHLVLLLMRIGAHA